MKLSPQITAIAFGSVLAAGAIYALKKFFNAASDVTDKALAPIVQPIAEAIAGPKVSVADGFIISDGRKVTFNQLIASGGKVASDQTLVWQGVKYRLTNRRPDGWYSAERA